MASVEVKKLTKIYGQNTVLDHIDIQIPDGVLVSLLGPSGCGKTTTLRLIAGFEQEDGGEIYIGEKKMNGVPVHKRNIGMVFQSYALFPHMSVYQNVAYGLEQRRLKKQDIARRVDEALELVKLSDYRHRKPKQLSGGQQQRVALARALVIKPQILLLDECLSALDKKLRVEMQVELRRILEQSRITTLFVTHDQEEALTLSDYVIVMNHGRIEQMGRPFEVYEHPKNKFVAGFLGKANFFEGEITDSDKTAVTISAKEQPMHIGVNRPLAAGRKGVYAIRPEKLQFQEKPEDGFWLEGTVQFMTYAGNISIYTIDVSGQEILMETSNAGLNGKYLPGSKVYLTWDPEHCQLLEDEIE